jgi:hypothetical protein
MGLPQNKDFMGIWETFKGSKYHVLGNHDMDKNSKAEMVDYWEMPGSYYSWDYQGVHFVVLDANFLHKDGTYIDYERANFYVDDSYRTFIDPRQINGLSPIWQLPNHPPLFFPIKVYGIINGVLKTGCLFKK